MVKKEWGKKEKDMSERWQTGYRCILTLGLGLTQTLTLTLGILKLKLIVFQM